MLGGICSQAFAKGTMSGADGEVLTCPVLLLTLTRPTAAAPKRLPASHMRLVLGELQAETCVELVHALVPGIDASPEVVQTIVQKGQGNPFFVQAIIGALLDQGILVRDDTHDGVTVRGAIGEVSVPDTVWDVLAERIDRLDADQKHALQMAAIIGSTFWKGLVGELTGIDEIDVILRSLQDRGFVEPLGPAAFAGEWEWTFRHVLVQDVVYAGMLRSVRRAAHLRVGAWLEQRAAERRGEYVPLLAYHFQRGEDWHRTAEFAEETGDRAALLYANREAGDAYRQGVDALALLPPEAATQRRMIELILKLAQVSYASPTEEVLPSLETAKSLAALLADDALTLRVSAATTTWLWMKQSLGGFN